MKETKDANASGMDIRRKMFGSAGAEDAVAAATDFTASMQDLVTRYCFGEVWTRPCLDHKTRSMLTLTILATLGRPNQFKAHVRGAIVNGATKDEIREVLLHTMIYAGVPIAVDSFGLAAEVLKELNLE